MSKQELSVSKLYKVRVQDYGSNTVPTGALLLMGDTVSVAINGSQELPIYATDMVVLTEDATITAAGAYSFSILPTYIYITGTITAIQLVGYLAEEEVGFAFTTPD